MADPSDPRAARVCTKLAYTPAGAESARQTVTLQGGGTVTPAYMLAGFRLVRTGGSAGSLSVTVRYFEATGSEQDDLVYERAATIAADGDPMISTGLEIPLNGPDFAALTASVQDSGADQTYKLYTFLSPIRVV